MSLGQETDDGFTLVELLVIIVILGILAAVVVLGVTNAEGSSAVSACRSSFKLVESAQEAYKAQTGSYAGSLNQLVGVWLKEAPRNGGSYVISIDNHAGPSFGSVMVASDTHAATDGETNCAYSR